MAKSEHRFHYVGSTLPLGAINVLEQPRKTFVGLDSMADDIADKQLLNPPTVAQFERATVQTYLEVNNRMWGTEHRLDELKPVKRRGKERYFVLLAGERRFRSCRLLWRRGCADCRERWGEEPKGRCFRRHFPGGKIEVRLCVNIPAIPALELQLSENTHMPVPPHEEAQAYARLFRLIREEDPRYPMARFARKVGRSPQAIKNALRFCHLPVAIQRAVEDQRVAYGAAVEIARLQEIGLKQDELEWWMMRAVAERKKLEDFRQLVRGQILARTSGQVSLFQVMSAESERLERRRHIRRVVGEQSVKSLWTSLAYFRTVLGLFHEGRLGRPESPYSEASPSRLFRKHVDQLRELLPFIRAFLPKQAAKTAEEVLQEAERQLAAG